MSIREDEKVVLDKIVALRATETVKLFEKLFRIRLEMHKDSLVVNESDVVRGRAQECRTMLKELKLNGD